MNFRLAKYAPKKGFNRQPGEMDTLKNLTPTLTGSEKTRYGYQAASTGVTDFPAIDGVATGITGAIWRTASTERPSAKQVWFLFGDVSGTKKVFVQPWYGYSGGTLQWNDSWLDISESLDFQDGSDVTVGASYTVTILGSDAKGFAIEDNYYVGWKIDDLDGGPDDLIIDSSYSSAAGGTTILTTRASHTSGTTWTSTDHFRIKRFFHDDSNVFEPTLDFPTVTTINGIFRISFGASGSSPIWYGYIDRNFFPAESAPSKFSYGGVYASTRECKSPSFASDATLSTTTSSSPLTLDKTYWVGLSVIYDGFQHSPIGLVGSEFMASGGDDDIHITVFLNHGSLNKRITSVELYIAQDDGDTTSTGRVNPYFFIKEFPLTDLTFTDWSLDDTTTHEYYIIFDADGTVWTNKGDLWSQRSGYDEGVDTIYTFDHEISTGERQWIARVSGDTDNIYTNPKSSDGVVQVDIFPDESERYKHRVLWGDTSFITGVVATELGRIVVLKDRALVDIGISELADNSLILQSTVVSTQIGCASKTGYLVTPYGLFFAGYDDIYQYNQGQLSNLTFEDWENIYRGISSSVKQAAIMWFRVEDNSVFVQLGSDAYAYFLSTKSWRQNTYAAAVAYYTVTRGNSIVWQDSSANVYVFDTSTTDAGTAISASWDTGYMRLEQAGSVLDVKNVFINKTVVASSGTLEVKVLLSLNGSVTTLTKTTLSKSDTRLWIPIPIGTLGLSDFVKIQYNTNASPETGALEFAEIEVDAIPERKLVYA